MTAISKVEDYLSEFSLDEGGDLFPSEDARTHVDTVEAGGDRVRRFTNEYWTAGQRQGHSLHEISYRACYKAELPGFFIDLLTRPGDLVYDPFQGRGTTLVEAALRAYLMDRKRSWKEDRIDRWIRMVATNRLTGHSAGFFSVYTLPPNQAVSPEAQIKINERRRPSLSSRRIPFSCPPPFLVVVHYAADNWLRCRGVSNNSKGTNTNRVVVFRKEKRRAFKRPPGHSPATESCNLRTRTRLRFDRASSRQARTNAFVPAPFFEKFRGGSAGTERFAIPH